MSQGPKHKTIRMLGLDITFPFEPYGVQKAMTSKILLTLMNRENCLIESPTGTGKTLVLLTSTLAWILKSKSIGEPFIITATGIEKAKLANQQLVSNGALLPIETLSQLDGNNNRPTKRIKTVAKCAHQTRDDATIEHNQSDKSNPVPRIYYGTRMHTQITQVIRELNNTIYCENLRVCVLSSRDYTCINKRVRESEYNHDLCQELIKSGQSISSNMSSANKRHPSVQRLPAGGGNSCRYYKDIPQLSSRFDKINTDYNKKCWDIEDSVKFGTKNAICPYYGTRLLQDKALLTFAPYNYLLDPIIRKSMNIDLNNAIVIFDEAHNIEDTCRSAASFVINTEHINELLETIQVAFSHYKPGSVIMCAYEFFNSIFINLCQYLESVEFESDEGLLDKQQQVVVPQFVVIDKLNTIGLGLGHVVKFKENLKTLLSSDDETYKEVDINNNICLGTESIGGKTREQALSFNQIQLISRLSIILDYIYGNECGNFADYRFVVTRTQTENTKSYIRTLNTQGVTEIKKQYDRDDRYTIQLSILCMNPSVAFKDIQDSAWAIIVASGTLSPIESLASELDCKFFNIHHGAHVIQRERVFTSVLPTGPNNLELACVYGNWLKLNFQDEIGLIVRDVCKIVPNGVLCFFPSYDRMETLYQRWLATGYLADIRQAGKGIFRERKNSTVNEFNTELGQYYKWARVNDGGVGGALMLAVFRGKVSEGIDFADSAARAVISVGIPYPTYTEVGVKLKRQYNDSARVSRPQLMSGQDWYNCQAFRALNQALGRCIRHKQDWGAIIMIDARLKSCYNLSNMSKWIQNHVQFSQNQSYNSMINTKLRQFVELNTNSL